MKNSPDLLVVLIAALMIFGCSAKHDSEGVTDNAEWPEMESFHMVMADAYHPFKDSANLEAAKSLAPNLAAEADDWAAASLPEKVNDEQTKQRLQKLKADAHTLADMVNSHAPDDAIGKQLTGLHDSFHMIMESWNDNEEENEKHEHQK